MTEYRGEPSWDERERDYRGWLDECDRRLDWDRDNAMEVCTMATEYVDRIEPNGWQDARLRVHAKSVTLQWEGKSPVTLTGALAVFGWGGPDGTTDFDEVQVWDRRKSEREFRQDGVTIVSFEIGADGDVQTKDPTPGSDGDVPA